MYKPRNISSESETIMEITCFSASSGAKELYNEIKEEKSNLNPEKLVCVQTDRTSHNLNVFKNSLDFASDIYSGKFSLKDTEKKATQNIFIIGKTKSEI